MLAVEIMAETMTRGAARDKVVASVRWPGTRVERVGNDTDFPAALALQPHRLFEWVSDGKLEWPMAWWATAQLRRRVAGRRTQLGVG